MPQLDPTLVNLAKALRDNEGGLDPTKRGKSGEYGMYQFMPDTWKSKAAAAGVNVPLEQSTKEQQNEVAYKTLARWKQEHPDWNVGNFASAWNAGEGAPNAYQENHKGTNAQGVAYDTPTYAKKVADSYQKYKGGSTPPTEEVAGASTSKPPKPDYDTYGASFPVSEEELNSTSLGTTLGTTAKAVGNLPSSFLNLGKGLLSAIAHPIQTLGGIGGTVVGTTENVLGKNKNNPSEAQQLANSVGKAFTDRYGSVRNAARSATNDPAGVGADVLSILYGGSAALDKFAGTTGADIASATARQGFDNFGTKGLNVMPTVGEGKFAGLLNKGLTSVAEPVANGVKNVASLPGKVAAQTMGLQTGVGGGPITEGFKASATGGQANRAFLDGLRGNATPDQLVTHARDALGEVLGQRSAEYKQMLSSLGKDSTTYDISPIYRGVDEQLNKFGISKTAEGLDFSRSKFALDTTAQRDIEKLYDYVKSYGGKKGDRTALGIDNLKQVLGGYYSPNSDYRAFVQGVKSTTRKVLDDAPGYTKSMAAYSDMTDTIKDIVQSLSLGDKAALETTFKKLTSSLKNNEFRKQVIQQLDEATGGQLLAKIAGHQMSSLVPRGLAGVLEGGLGGISAVLAPHSIPALLALAVTTSPRVVGEFIHALGVGARGTNAIMNVLNKASVPTTLGSNALNRANPQGGLVPLELSR